jgi:hypothetical protein
MKKVVCQMLQVHSLIHICKFQIALYTWYILLQL